MKDQSSWNVPASSFSKKTFNPIRNIVENMKIEPHPQKQMIALSIGDPTVFGNLVPAPEVVEAVVESIRSGKHNGYIPSTGTEVARAAVAEYMSVPSAPLESKDIIICSGCSCALDLCLTAVGDAGMNILVPRPGFPLYTTLSEGFGVSSKFYDVLPEKNWLIDLDHLESQIDSNTAAILMNNPSNPCGSVYPKEHLEGIAAIAVKYKIPVIADEIYDHFVFEGHEYHPIASVNPDLPVLACGGLTKRFLVPGWRTGWVAVHNRGGALTEVFAGLKSLSQRIIGSNTIVQAALPTILRHTPQAFFDDTLQKVQSNARQCYSEIQRIPGLVPIQPQGAMYMMVRINIEEFPGLASDLDFVEKMVAEQSVFCLPGKCFKIANYFRIVLTVPPAKMKEACERMRAFCEEHHISNKTTGNKRVKLDADTSDAQVNEPLPGTQTNGHAHPKTNGVVTNGNSCNLDHSITNGNNTATKNCENNRNGNISSNELDSDNEVMKKEVAKIQSAMIKECAIRSNDELVDEMEHD